MVLLIAACVERTFAHTLKSLCVRMCVRVSMCVCEVTCVQPVCNTEEEDADCETQDSY